MFGFITKLFPSKKEKDVAALQPLVAEINTEFAKLAALSDDHLRAQTAELKAIIRKGQEPFEAKLASLNERADALRASGEVASLESLFLEIDSLKKERNAALEVTLMQILPRAFAVVKETCRRWVEVGELRVTATEWDAELAARKPNVVISGDTATWKSEWLVTGNLLRWNMIHYDVQLMGGIVLHQGKIAEMATGEGKTLVSTLPSYLNALAGYGVNLVTVNDYLARRDAEWNAPLFEFHGLRVDCIDLHEPNTDARRQAYLADITYGTNNEFGFDYLRDNMVTHPEHLVQRELHFAMVDEVDSVLIDEARTPLIISGPVADGDRQEFDALRPRIDRLVTLQRRVVGDCITEAKQILTKAGDKVSDKDQTKAGEALLRAHRGLPKHGPLLKFLNESGMKTLLQKIEARYMQDNSRDMPLIDEGLYFTIDETNRQTELTEKGREAIAGSGEDPNLFVLPDVTAEIYHIDADTATTPEQKLAAKEELLGSFGEKSERLHTISQLLKAYCLFEKDVEYIVAEGKVMLVDEHTGRVLPGRRYSDGLHQAIEAKENVKIEAATQTYATVTLQNYFRMYHKLAGMTGTAETEAVEFYGIYKLDVVVIPTNRVAVRADAEDLVYKTRREKYNALAEEIVKLRDSGRPVLVGTTSVEVSELLSRMLKLRGIKHNVLNAKQHQRESEIVAEAGQATVGPDGKLMGTVTIATNMAGRGTDIKLGPGVAEAGGLAIVGSERHDSRRIDRQLRGRAGRQGDPGSSQFYVALDDELMRLFGGERIARVMDFLKIQEGEVIQDKMITRSITNAQKKVEENHYAQRKRLLEYDDVMNSQREAVYRRRRNALFGDRIRVDLDNMVYDFCAEVVGRFQPNGDVEGLRLELIRSLGIDPVLSGDVMEGKVERLTDALYTQASEAYQRKRERLAASLFDFARQLKLREPRFQFLDVALVDGSKGARILAEIDELVATQGRHAVEQFEKGVVLGVIDERWKNHLREMDDLRQSVATAVYEQKDPLLIYKFEGYKLFQAVLAALNQEVLSMLFRGDLEDADQGAAARERAEQVRRDDFSRLKVQHADANAALPPSQRQLQPVGADEGYEGGPQSDRPLSRRERRENERKQGKKR
jgi:preprotein translocase subunit SecA